MKRSISILLCLALIFSSFSFAAAADWSTTDSNNLATIKNSVISGGQLYNVVNSCNTALNNINYNLVMLMGWLDPANGGGTTALLNQILNALVYTDAGGAIQSWLYSIDDRGYNTVYYLNSLNSAFRTDPMNNMSFTIGPNGTYTMDAIQSYNFVTSVIHGFNTLRIQMAQTYGNEFSYLASMYNTTQSLVSFADPDSTITFMPSSVADGVFKYLNAINTPLARLGYVLASDSRIEAQEAAAANEQAVVDNFIDSTGDGSVPTSSFSDVSGLSSGVTSNLSTDASPAQIWDIFNSDHGSWFSQETANQLDTTTRTRGSEFETPLLDQQMEEIYKSLGGGK